MAWLRFALLVPLALFTSAGCGVQAPAAPGTSADLAASPEASLDGPLPRDFARAAAGDLAGQCVDGVAERALGGVCVFLVNGQLVDDAGAVLKGAMVTVCASSCWAGTTDDTGHFSVKVGNYIRVELYSLITHINPRRAAYYLALPAPVDGVVTFPTPLPALSMPMSGPAILTDQSAQTLHGDGLDLFIDARTTIFFSVDDTADMPLGAELRPLRFTRYDKLPFITGFMPDVVYGFGPFDLQITKPVRLSFANGAALPANAAVDVLVQRGLVVHDAPGFRFDVAATAHVSANGTRIDMDPGTGLDTLTWVALKMQH